MTKIPNFNQNCFGHLDIGVWDLFEIWDLEIGISNLKFDVDDGLFFQRAEILF
jgi:hypothetical protein